MAINKQTIISAFDEKLTLLQWLKTINKALDEAVLTGVEVRQKGNATFSFVVTFEDGTELESNEFVLAQGESINGATIRNGHLYLSLTNGNELDAGNVKPVTSFEINASQHLIVNYGDGTSQDLGAIFSGNVNVDGSLNATKVTGNEIVENMSGYSFSPSSQNITRTNQYASVVKNGNKVTLVYACILTPLQTYPGYITLGTFTLPSSVGQKIIPIPIDGMNYVAECKSQKIFSTINSSIDIVNRLDKSNNTTFPIVCDLKNAVANTSYVYRFEVTFLLSDNMVA